MFKTTQTCIMFVLESLLEGTRSSIHQDSFIKEKLHQEKVLKEGVEKVRKLNNTEVHRGSIFQRSCLLQKRGVVGLW